MMRGQMPDGSAGWVARMGRPKRLWRASPSSSLSQIAVPIRQLRTYAQGKEIASYCDLAHATKLRGRSDEFGQLSPSQIVTRLAATASLNRPSTTSIGTYHQAASAHRSAERPPTEIAKLRALSATAFNR